MALRSLPVPKPRHKRTQPRRGVAGTFSPKTRKAIIERDNGLCVRCGAQYQEIHHVIFRSALGKGTFDNGVCICNPCHVLAHKYDEERRWFERYKDKYLLPKCAKSKVTPNNTV